VLPKNIALPKNAPHNLGQYAQGTLYSGTLRYRFGFSLGGNQLEVGLSNELGTSRWRSRAQAYPRTLNALRAVDEITGS
jgi:hypothetical protein